MRYIYKVKLHKLKSNHSNLSFDTYTGSTGELPAEGFPFYMRTKEEGRLHTTLVRKAVVELNSIFFQTKNSTYRLVLEGE